MPSKLSCYWRFTPQKKKLDKILTENYCNPDNVNVQDSCPTGVYDDLRKIKNQLGDISDEVEDALNAQKHYRKPKWDIRVISKQQPIITGPIGGKTTKEDFGTEYENIISQDGKHKRLCMINQNIKPFVPKVEKSCNGKEQAVGDGGCNYQCSDKFPGFKYYRSDLGGCVKDYCYKPTNKAMADPYFKSQCSVRPPAQTAKIDIQWTVGDGNPGDKYEYAVSCKNKNGRESAKMVFGSGSGSNLQPYLYTVAENRYQPPFCWKSLPSCSSPDHSRVLYQKRNDGEWFKIREVPSNIKLSTGIVGGEPGVCTWLGPSSDLPPADGWLKYPGKDMVGNDIGCSWMPMSDYNNLDKLKKNCLDRKCVGFIKVKQKGNNNTFFYCPKNKAGKNYLTNYNFNFWDSGDAYVHYK